MPVSVKLSISSVMTDALPADPLEKIAIRDEGDALSPRSVARRKVRFNIVGWAKIGAHAAQQLFFHRLRLVKRAAREDGLIVQDLAAHDLVDPGLVDLQLAQRVGEFVGVAAG